MVNGPVHTFRTLVNAGELSDDIAQRMAVEKLQMLHVRLKGYDASKPKSVGLGLFGWGRENITEARIPGLYLYGGVGRGKSMLMDLFYYTAEVEKKRRVHFHAFMQEVHEGIREARKLNKPDPIEAVAKNIAKETSLLCFDEMQIADITDAMIVGRLFEKLLDRGVGIVATSNRHPDDLYENGLNRQLFMPFIRIIKENLEVHHLASRVDYRQDREMALARYFTPLGAKADRKMDEIWDDLVVMQGGPYPIRVKGRDVVLPQYFDKVARASFDDLCGQPLGAADYLAIVKHVNVLLLENIPVMSKAKNNEAKRFVTLIDTLYEAKVRLICSAAAEPDELYVDGSGAFEFERTASRLEEMRAEDWGK